MSFMDACCLQITLKGSNSRGSKDKQETSYTFQTRDPNVKKEWIVGEETEEKEFLSLSIFC